MFRRSSPPNVVVGPRDPDADARVGRRALEGAPDLLLQGRGRAPADEDLVVVEPVEGDGVREAPGDHRSEAREARLVDVGGRDVPAVEGRSVAVPALAPPRARPPAPRRDTDALGLRVRARLDVAAVRSDDDEAALAAVVPEPLDELPLGLRPLLGDRRVRHPRVDHAGELAARPEPPPARGAHADDAVRGLLAGLAHRVERWAGPRRALIRTWCPTSRPIAASRSGSAEQCSRRVLRSFCDGRALRIVASYVAIMPPADAPPREELLARGASPRRSLGVAPSIRQSSAMSSSPSTGSIRVVARPPASRPLTRR